jgi:hypothetical protein
MKHSLFLLMIVLSAVTTARADDLSTATQTLNQVSKINQSPTCDPYATMTRPQKCQEKMKRLYKDGTANVDIFLGYGDAGGNPPYNWNSVERAYLIQKLYVACGAGRPEPCGFKADPKNADRLSKTLPDGKKVVVNVHNSAHGIRDDLNRNHPDQQKITNRMNEKFKKALRENEAVFYIGHSRDGGGPDFGPPRLLANGHTDYAWYRKNRPGLKMIQESMSKSHPELYGSFSCDSLNHFSNPIRKKNSDVIYFGTTRVAYQYMSLANKNGVMLPDRITSSEVVDSALLAVGGIATRKCEFNKTFTNNKQPTQADYE